MVNLNDFYGRRAVDLLAENEPKEAIELLRSNSDLGRIFRENLADMLEGHSPNNTKLKVVPVNGRIKKSQKTLERDLNIHAECEALMDESNCTLADAIQQLNGMHGLGEESLRKIYQRMSKAHEDYFALCRDG